MPPFYDSPEQERITRAGLIRGLLAHIDRRSLPVESVVLLSLPQQGPQVLELRREVVVARSDELAGDLLDYVGVSNRPCEAAVRQGRSELLHVRRGRAGRPAGDVEPAGVDERYGERAVGEVERERHALSHRGA